MQLRKPETLPLLFIIASTLLLCSLGFWQLQRLHWKEKTLEQVKAAQEMPALGGLPDEVSGLDYRLVHFTGHFLYDKTLHLVGGRQNEGSGYNLLTPFELEDDGRIILVNRGFSPLDKESKPEGSVDVEGIIRPARIKRTFAPENRPDKNVWFYEDFTAMSAATGLSLTPIVVEAVGAPKHGVYPMPSDGKIILRNDHLQYAITWFAIAFIGVVMFILYHRKPRK